MKPAQSREVTAGEKLHQGTPDETYRTTVNKREKLRKKNHMLGPDNRKCIMIVKKQINLAIYKVAIYMQLGNKGNNRSHEKNGYTFKKNVVAFL